MASAQQLEWLHSIVPAAKDSQTFFGVPASITLAQCILESGWGTTRLAKECNNYFGIKAEHLDDPSTYQVFPTAEFVHGQRVTVQADFEKYPNIDSSFRDHARLLAMASRYGPAMAVKTDSVAFAKALQICGYSTSPTYAASLIGLMEEFHLRQYDGA